MATVYLPAPIKVENNRTDSKPDTLLWAGCSLALGILSYYAPKTFLATSVGMFAYQVYRFNQLVQTSDASKHQQIHKWAINACLVMWSVGTVFGLKSLPCFWFALKDLRHLHLLHGVGHVARGVLMIIVAACLAPFDAGAKNLASRRRWVEMEDYVTNYPPGTKQFILSSYGRQFVFYFSALLPQIEPVKRLSAKLLVFSQFQPEGTKFTILRTYFNNNPNMRQWPLAIHQFQQLSVANQIALGPQLKNILSQDGMVAERDALPDDVKAVRLNEALTTYAKVPSNHEAGYGQWQSHVTEFEKLPREQQSILGNELLRLIGPVSLEALPHIFPDSMRLAALKTLCRAVHNHQILPMDLANAIFEGLSDAFKAEFGVFLKGLIANGTLELRTLSPQMQAVLPRTVL